MEPIHILLVEDSEGDILLTQEALEEAKIITQLSVVKDGKEAIDFVTLQGRYSNATKPDLILLDINLPKKNGHEVLQYLKGDKNLKHIPVIVLTTSSFQKDINLAYDNYVNCYITKPIEAKDFQNTVTSIENFWMYIVKLPVKGDAINDKR
ncbi:MAG: response regulator [Chitinophagaceae bacterium]